MENKRRDFLKHLGFATASALTTKPPTMEKNLTAMQELIKWLVDHGWGEGSMMYDKATELLTKEKQGYIDAYRQGEWDVSRQDRGFVRKHTDAEDYYNSTYQVK